MKSRKKQDHGNSGRRLSRQKIILFIEDDPFVAQEYGIWMKARSFRVTYAYSVDEAVLQAKKLSAF
jgi:ActR/RegA family two-component response regulator